MTSKHDGLIKKLMKEALTISDISLLLKCDDADSRTALSDISANRIVKKEGVGKNARYFIRLNDDTDSKYIISPASSKVQNIRMVLASDLHAGCRQFDSEGLEHILDLAKKEDFEHVYISGDLHDGHNVYKGHNNNLVAWKVEDQVSILGDILSKHKLHYRAIGGNHDYSWEEQGNINPVKLLSNLIPNFEYLGATRADLLIAGIAMRMVHGGGGKAYARSYPGQVYLRNMMGNAGLDIMFGDEPHRLGILQIGHYHTRLSYTEYGVEVLHPGNFQRGNDFTERLGLVGPQGAYFIKFKAQNGKLLDFESRFVFSKKS